MNLLSLSPRNLRRLTLAWLRCMGASARESRVSVAIYSLDVVGRPGLHQSGLTSLCFVGCFSPGPRRNDLMIYWALGPFVRSFTPLVDPGDIYPPHAWLSISLAVASAAVTSETEFSFANMYTYIILRINCDLTHIGRRDSDERR